MLTGPINYNKMIWTLTRENLSQVCTDLGLEWYYDPISYKIVFRRKGIENTTLHDLEMCFGDPDNLEFVAAKEVLMRMGYDDIRSMLDWWMKGRLTI